MNGGKTEVTFLLDGAEFFTAIYNELQRVKNAHTDSYVHLAYWTASHQTSLTDPITSGGTILLGDELKAVASQPHVYSVRVILWDPGSLATWVSTLAEDVRKENQEFKRELNGFANGKLEVELEPYGGTGMSQHQKIAIFSADGLCRVIVGGQNLSNWYWDVIGHPGIYPGGYRKTIHDTAVLLEGPASEDVEKEWNRRWKKVSQKSPEGPTRTQPKPNGSSVQVAVTDYENGKREIFQTLLAKIQQSHDYIYLENYAIIDSALIQAIAMRLKASPTYKAILMVPRPDLEGTLYSYLHYLVETELALARCTEIDIDEAGAQKTIQRAGQGVWEVHQEHKTGTWQEMAKNKWLEDSALAWGKDSASVTKTLFKDIKDIRGGTPLYCPVRAQAPGSIPSPVYIHSKLGLIDDTTMCVGSANFNYRSMHYDGELSVFIEDTQKVPMWRARLFGEWQMTNASSWSTTAEAHKAAINAGTATPGLLYVIPLGIRDFNRTSPGSAGGGSNPWAGGSSGGNAATHTDRTWW